MVYSTPRQQYRPISLPLVSTVTVGLVGVGFGENKYVTVSCYRYLGPSAHEGSYTQICLTPNTEFESI